MPRRYFAFLVFLFLSGCGMLKVDVDFGRTPAQAELESTPTATASSLPAAAQATFTQTAGTAPFPAGETPASATVSPAVPRAVDIALGKTHSCAVLDTGRVMCWGKNEYRQLGNGSMVNSAVPVEVEGIVDAKAVTAGWAHTCVLTAAGGVKCWGFNKNGELGNGVISDSGMPADVRGLVSGVQAVEAGDDHTCAVTDAGAVKCWGYNRYGQLGDGSTVSRSVPVRVQGLAGGVSAVAAGWGHTCVLTPEKSVRCWGNNEYGQLGYGQTEDYRFTPMEVTGLAESAERISADGGQACALTIYGGIRCWGNNKYGQLGDGTAEMRNTPVTVVGLEQGMRAVEAGWNHTCGITTGNGVLCWGWNYMGQLGDGTKASRTTPVEAYGLSKDVEALSVGWSHTCAVTDIGSVKCWGANESGQLGDGTDFDSQIPLAVMGLGGSAAPPPDATPTATPAEPTRTSSEPTSTQTP